MTLPKNSPKGSWRSSPKNKFQIRLFIIIAALIVVGAVASAYVVVARSQTKKSALPIAQVAPIVPKDVAVITEISLFLMEKNLKPTNIVVSGGDVTFEVAGTETVLPLADLDNALPIFWQVWSKYSLLNKHLRKVDLRFVDPIVTY